MTSPATYKTDSDLNIRKVRIDDIGQLLPILYQLSPLKSHETEDQERLKTVLEEIIADKNHHIFVCESGGQIVGSATLLIQQNLTHGGRPYGHIENVVTHASCRKKGVGKLLVTELHKIAKQYGCHKVILECSKENVQFYQKCGMKETGEVEMRIDT